MRKSFFSLFILAISMVIISNDAKAQLPEGQVGIGANFESGLSTAGVFYAFTQQVDLGINFGYHATTVGDNTSSGVAIGAGGRYFLADNAIDPFVTLGFNYFNSEVEGTVTPMTFARDGFRISGGFGAQAQLVKNLFLFSSVGLTYNILDIDGGDGSIFNFGSFGVGALYYFDN
ncbi:MAG: hypothetical protein Kapaf2KO_11480 [Candidatus Kapaibacteriales bacterium]